VRMSSRWCGVLAAVLAAACARSGTKSTSSSVVRLVDAFKPEILSGTPAGLKRDFPPTEWKFSSAEKDTWEAGPGVTALTIRDGRLAGRTTTTFPVIHLQRTKPIENPDLLHAIEIRMKVSAVSPGGQLSFTNTGAEKVNVAEIASGGDGFWQKAPVTAGDEIQTVTLTSPMHLSGQALRHLIIKPTDQAGATFEIESVRLIFRKEFLASVPSGVTWQGMKEIYRESIAARAPETATFSVAVPEHAWLDLAVGTVEDDPVTFKITASAGNTAGGKSGDVLLERTVTTPHRWEQAPIDLSKYAGQTVTLACSLASPSAGALGFWGAPAIRVHSPEPPRASDKSGGGGVSAAAAARPRGVILMQADTLRRDHLGLYGYERETAPVLRKLAGEGVRFANYTTQATWTKVSTPTLMTSLYPTSHGIADFFDSLPASANTLAESFRNAGFATLSFSSVLFTGQFTHLHKGFEELHEDGSVAKPDSSKTAREFVDRLAAWLETHRDAPFFVFLHVFDPHDPYEPSAPYNAMWADPSKKDEHERQSKDVKKFIKDPLMKQFGMPARDELQKAGIDPAAYVQYDEGWYDGSIRAMDVEIGRLVERLRELGLDDNTLFVFLSDHGEEFHDHGRMFHGQTVYGELTQTPLIVRWPAGLPKGRVVNDVVQTIDVFPTLLDLNGIAPPAGIQGQSLAPLLTGQGQWKARPAISEKAKTASAGAPPPLDTESFAIVDGGWKLIHNTARHDGDPEYELYDFNKDPLNHTNVAADHADIVTRLSKELDGWHQMAVGAKLKPDSETTKSLTPAQLQRLRSLGYVK
jgi:arylsulfatase A-like enzyme